VNWKPKSENLKSLARELNVGLDSFIFVDDNPMEIAEVEANCPGVLALRLPEDTSKIPSFLEHAWIFDQLKVTEEDKKRARLYQENRQRDALRAQCLSMGEFLAGLNLQIQIEEARPDLERLGEEAHNAVQAWTWQAAGTQLDQALRSGLRQVENRDRGMATDWADATD